MSFKPTYNAPTSPPPHYANVQGISQQDTGPSNSNYQQPYLPPTSPSPHDANKIQPFAENQSHIYPPDPAYGGPGGYYSGPQGPPPQGYYAPGPGSQMGGYYGQPGMQGPPQGMYYQQQGPPPGMYGYPQQGPMYGYQQDRGMGGGVCAGILGALACCCCLDMLI